MADSGVEVDGVGSAGCGRVGGHDGCYRQDEHDDGDEDEDDELEPTAPIHVAGGRFAGHGRPRLAASIVTSGRRSVQATASPDPFLRNSCTDVRTGSTQERVGGHG